TGGRREVRRERPDEAARPAGRAGDGVRHAGRSAVELRLGRDDRRHRRKALPLTHSLPRWVPAGPASTHGSRTDGAGPGRRAARCFAMAPEKLLPEGTLLYREYEAVMPDDRRVMVAVTLDDLWDGSQAAADARTTGAAA